jgi:hypothetical protein
MCVSLYRFDLARAVQASSNLDDQSRARVATYSRVMESAPADVQTIFKESLTVVALALTFNSFFFFIIASVGLLIVVGLRSGFTFVKQVALRSGVRRINELFRQVKVLFWQRVDADTTVAFFSPELATV